MTVVSTWRTLAGRVYDAFMTRFNFEIVRVAKFDALLCHVVKTVNPFLLSTTECLISVMCEYIWDENFHLTNVVYVFMTSHLY